MGSPKSARVICGSLDAAVRREGGICTYVPRPCMCVCMCVCMYVCMYVCMCMYMRMCMYMCVCACVCVVCMAAVRREGGICTYVPRPCVCMYIYMCACVRVCVCIHRKAQAH